tara:strand:+ start:553 stop:1011 length:459 start_codon:yes stop_codon:yes gene_type:complete
MASQDNLRPIEILLVEDNPADVRLTEEGFKQLKVINNLHIVRDGDEALEFVFQRSGYADAPRPDIVLLDLNLPGTSGHEVLSIIKGSETHSTIPVVVLTSSESESDIAQSYSRHANCFITKPVSFSGFVDIVKRIDDFWFSIVRLPDSQLPN